MALFSSSTTPVVKTGMRLWGSLGAFASVCLLVGAVAWAHFTQINGAVIAAGKVIVQGKPKTIQHLDGGVIKEILVTDGDKVSAGEVLIRLEDTQLRANLLIYQSRLANASALRDRLRSEQIGSDHVEFRNDLPTLRMQDMTSIQLGQQVIFESRRDVQLGRREQLEEKIRQYSNQITGINALIKAKQEQLSSLKIELKGLVELSERGYTRKSQVLSMQRSQSDLLGQLGEHTAELARIANSIRDTELEILLAERQVREEVVTELREVNTSIVEMVQQIISTQKQLDRVEVRSPADGIVHEIQVSTIGGVVAPGAAILQVIPSSDEIVFETRIDPTSIDQVYLRQPARMRLSAFNQRTTPELTGTVLTISADAVLDEVSGTSFYRVLLASPAKQLNRITGRDIVPGMPVEAYLQTDERSVLSYLIKPFTEQMVRAFREE
ncbi:HlyD family type I secretion periplasmic adaptor subunit [Pseudovibrio japonicus]|uniref:Membrane fusion protein (MFP) family protein n=1 Tax=Pseudovibrio japonicus TaxID=366534 RepID=A0ABQ3ETL3_9HYPH|nr:HlyD family type I secretion periplasmic adaptor subunit [Pseudovibrio japonicus]GHB50077.1 HlyD family type I secretion periplasmic adaptor subunit [Pseudovibrio japonicus]